MNAGVAVRPFPLIFPALILFPALVLFHAHSQLCLSFFAPFRPLCPSIYAPSPLSIFLPLPHLSFSFLPLTFPHTVSPRIDRARSILFKPTNRARTNRGRGLFEGRSISFTFSFATS